MSTSTTNIGLTKPAYTDQVDVGVLNNNSDLIDQHIGSIESNVSSLTSTSTSHTSSITSLQNSKQDKITPTSMSQISDANDAIELGAYYLGSTASHKPGTENYTMFVMPSNTSGTTCIQIALNPNGANMYVRTYGNSQWYFWRKLINETTQIRGAVAEGTALNSILDAGWYWLNAAYVNLPHTGNGAGLLEVMKPGSAITIQRYTRFGGTDYTPINIYERIYLSDSWKPWATVATIST